MDASPLPHPNDDVPEVPFAPAPWRMRGEAWVGVFTADRELPLPAPWRPLLSARTVAVVVIRYREGTLQYDELIAGPLVRHGLRTGLLVERIWVDNATSLWGGRRIWGMPKQLARFVWDAKRVQVEDAVGPIARLSLGRTRLRAPLPLAPLLGIGRLANAWVLMPGRARGWAGPGSMRVEAWSDRFPYRLEGAATASIHASPLTFLFPPPHHLPDTTSAP